MMFATILLSFLPQEPVSPTTLPEVGTENAVQAQNEFRTWLGAAAKSPASPVHMKYDVQASMGLFDPAGNLEATFSGVLNSHAQSQSKLRHQLSGMANLNGDRDVPVEAILVLDGEFFWLALHADGIRVIPEEGIYLTGEVADLQKLYAFMLSFHAWSVEQEVLHEVEPSLGLGANLAAFFGSLPEQGVELLHPTSTMLYAMAPFTCQRLERKHGTVLASMAFDTQPESFVVEFATQWDAFWSGFLGSEKQERSSHAAQILGEHLFFTLSFDEATAIPLALNIEFDISAETLGLGDTEERMTFFADISGQLSTMAPMEASLFSAPLPDQVPTDVTGLLEMALTEMRNEKAEAESKADSQL